MWVSVLLSVSVWVFLSVSVSVCLSLSVSVWVSVSMSVCLSVCVPVCLSMSVSVCLYVSVSLFVCECVNMSVCECVSMTVCECVSMPVCECQGVYLWVFECVCLRVCQYACLSVSVYLSVSVCVCLFVKNCGSFGASWLRYQLVHCTSFSACLLILLQQLGTSPSSPSRCIWCSTVPSTFLENSFQYLEPAPVTLLTNPRDLGVEAFCQVFNSLHLLGLAGHPQLAVIVYMSLHKWVENVSHEFIFSSSECS